MKRKTLDPSVTDMILGVEKSSVPMQREARPVQIEGKSFVLVLVRPMFATRPGTFEVRILLLDASGRRLDELLESCSTRDGSIDVDFAAPPPGDGTVACTFRVDGQSSKVTKRVAIRDGQFMTLP
jgi:hypothetical protein